jgi:hypothetical protein
VAFFDDLHTQIGGMFWVVVIGAPMLVLVMAGQVVLRARLRTKQLKQLFRAGSIVTDSSAPTTGSLAFGLACGASIAVSQGLAWNDPSASGLTMLVVREELADQWGVSGPDDWRRVMDRLLAERGDEPADVAVDLRREANAGTPDLAAWLRSIEQAASMGRVSRAGAANLATAAERIHRYEERFRADGLIPEGGVVSSSRAYDWGRAVNLARWGVRAGYVDGATAYSGVLRAGELSVSRYSSWADFSAGFGLGQMLFFDEDDFPLHYVEMREAHRKLLADEAGPWRTLSWPAPVAHQ